jgi:hypothetical protein
MSYFVGLDLGQSQDPSAVCVVEMSELRGLRDYSVRHLQRYRLGTSYVEIVAAVTGLMRMLGEEARLIVDATGVGRPVVDLLVQAGLSPVPVTITGGDRASFEGGFFRVPKRDLVSAVVVALQAKKLKISPALPDADVLVKELLNFKVRIDPKTSHDSYAAWREGAHDDLVLACALAVWFASRTLGLLDVGPDPQGPDQRWLQGLPEIRGEDRALIRGGAWR